MLVVENSVDTFHSWDPSNPHWTETFWFGAWVPEAAVTVYIYHWFRPVLGIYGGGCLIWDAEYHLPWDIPAFHYDVNRPIPGTVDMRALELDCGTYLRTVEEGHRYVMGFRRDDIDVELTFDAVTPPTLASAKGMGEFFHGHIDQSGRYGGHVRYAGRSYDIDCYGIRDRSWGPRVITNDIRMNYCHGQSDQVAFVVYSKPDERGEHVFKGYLSRDGRRADLASGSRVTRFVDGRLESVEIDALDEEGRRLKARGTPLNCMPYLPYPNLLTWLYLMRWETDGGVVVYGEEQDVYSLPLWRASNRRGARW